MITLAQLKLLSEAVSDAEAWRGSLVGCAPYEAIEDFDNKIKRMRAAVKAARETRDSLKAHKLALEYARDN